ncbi:hypothetical protein A2707_06055 [Candidatus Saccharibacteria bacterium RIFCSPHIGHO2_01_FULL_45_15]|nr:MAG: hypothetical protein A2707_06055 [Candidatus Saccharibacteria bacterium RIFCSPHIGHO2_01_FULL_45_15]OGL27565.1 MAG: hypothetical protein A3C39_04680 [Candidatus Saccharibacteria bacterium RIFCSPHIGHO2_02_FULL_46_12]OGL32023.1 MAG: hypothetical protein A3E76_02000 [Candidatus Saccharibacteria bacterium RIFCSPHIGHO2_12_FULL_44_22]
MTQTFERSTAQSNISEHSRHTYEYPYSGCVSYQTLDKEGDRDPSFLEADIKIYPENNTFRVITPEELAFKSFMKSIVEPHFQESKGDRL